MSEVFQLNEVADLPAVQFYSGGVAYDPTPAPTVTVFAPDGTPSTPTLTKQGSGTSTRFVLLSFTKAVAGEYQINYATTDPAADFPGYTDYARFGQTFVDNASKLHFTGSAGVEKVNSQTQAFDADALAQFFTTDTGEDFTDAVDGSVVKEIGSNSGGAGITAADVWDYLVSSAGIDATKMGGYLVAYLAGIKGKTDMITNGIVPAVVNTYNATTRALTLYYRDSYGGMAGGLIRIPVSDSYDLTDPNIEAIELGFKSIGTGPGGTPILVVESVSATLHEAVFAITSVQMTNLNPQGRWLFDMQITYSDGTKRTPIGGEVHMSGDVVP